MDVFEAVKWNGLQQEKNSYRKVIYKRKNIQQFN